MLPLWFLGNSKTKYISNSANCLIYGLDCTKRRVILSLWHLCPFCGLLLEVSLFALGWPRNLLWLMGQSWQTWHSRGLKTACILALALLLLWRHLQPPSYERAKWICWMMRDARLRAPAESLDRWVRPLISSCLQMYNQAQPSPAKELFSWANQKGQLTESWANKQLLF